MRKRRLWKQEAFRQRAKSSACMNPRMVLTYLRLRRSQMSAAIEPTTPIAASPDEASISGTGTPSTAA